MAAKEVLFDPGEEFSFPPHPTALEAHRLPRDEADVDSNAEQLDETETPDPREPPIGAPIRKKRPFVINAQGRRIQV